MFDRNKIRSPVQMKCCHHAIKHDIIRTDPNKRKEKLSDSARTSNTCRLTLNYEQLYNYQSWQFLLELKIILLILNFI